MAHLETWLHAFRLRTLPLAVSSIIVGSGLAAFADGFRPLVMALAVLTAVLLQILSNLSNDLGDHQHGTDNPDRVGPQRAVQSGAITPATMKRAMWTCGLLAFASGLALIVTALGFSWPTLVFLFIGLLALGAAVRYTYGRNPYGYGGFGDASVFLFFGLVGVLGTCYLHTQRFEIGLLLPAAAFGFFSAGVLNVNNLRDIRNDKASGKLTQAVRMGFEGGKGYHGILITGGLSFLMLFTALHFRGMPQWGFLITTPMLAAHLRQVLRTHDPAALDPQLKKLALGTFATAVAFSIGLWMV
ncbi:MAG: 1,4-dihydroxy-2-naphthoate octaprenyltransferase [Flavobacteriales bacterium]|nr:1,4-dihydroxy-2-naphthoate octaprenyltransferase [Flavobacteriales bacterium]